MAGTVTVTETPLRDNDQKIIGKRLVISATGDASDGTFPNTTLKKLRGYLQYPVITNPGSTAPTDNWDWAILDSVDSTADAAGGAGTDRDTTNTENAVATPSGSATPYFFDGGNYTLTISGNSQASATLQIVMRFLFVQKS